MPTHEKILLKNMERPGYGGTLPEYLAVGGYEAVRNVLGKVAPAEVIDIVKRSGLRGRGGAGFPTGLKWGFVPKDSDLPRYLLCNADESEPGTFKDRQLIERDPHQLLEGIILASYAIGCHRSYIYIRGELVHGAGVLTRALHEAAAQGFLGQNILGSGTDLTITLHRGAGAYICGEETALIESLEGKKGMPRIRPPFPAIRGLYQSPTVVNNVETLSNL
ncbi:MAG TPA: NADH-quinone oxidoreductase subunit F, partial [Candidatus Methylomirabilis sp.]|nr:NADH-quinone oxidoreductase subunit F [Candidatus Methylomirabilis sp.]